MIANRGMYMGVGGSNGAAAGVGHVKPLSYGTYGKDACGEDRGEYLLLVNELSITSVLLIKQ